MSDRLIHGSPILQGNDTVPGCSVPAEVMNLVPTMLQKCTDFGLDYYAPILEMLEYDHMSEIAAYGGFPVRYPHWRWGQEYEDIARGYEYGFSRIYEMVINTKPYCYIYLLKSNDLIDHVTVIVHALGHSDFFKNNIHFQPTDGNMLNNLANNGMRVRQYIRRWGRDVVTRFIDNVTKISTLIDPSSAWDHKKIKSPLKKDFRTSRFARRMNVERDYMDSFVNTDGWKKHEKKRIEDEDIAEQLDFFPTPERDIFKWVKDNGNFKPWQQDIISMLYDEAIYFVPQRQTKMLNEGWASYIDYHFMCKEGYVSLGQKTHDAGIFHYAKHKMQVLGGEYSQNPYKLGFELLLDIEDRYNKGKFGEEYEQCDNMQEKMNWNKNLNLGKQKIFDVRRAYNDYTVIQEFFTPEFCEEKKFFEYKHFPNGETVIVNKDFKSIKKKLLQQYQNGGLPYIRLVDPNHRGKKWFLLEHVWDGRPLYDKYVREVLTAIYRIWGHFVILSTKTLDEKDVVYVCDGTDPETHVTVLYRENYEEKFMK